MKQNILSMLPYALLLVGVVHMIFPSTHVDLNAVSVDICFATAILVFEIRRSKR